MVNNIPNSQFPIRIPLLRDASKALILERVAHYNPSRGSNYSSQKEKSGFKVILPNCDQGFLFKDIIIVLAQRIVDNKINLKEIKLEETFHKLLKDTVSINGDYVYPYMEKYEVYYLAAADWWIKFSVMK